MSEKNEQNFKAMLSDDALEDVSGGLITTPHLHCEICGAKILKSERAAHYATHNQ